MKLFSKSYKSQMILFKPLRAPELIYYTTGKAPARLDWYVPAKVGVDVGHAILGGEPTVVLNAMTGAAIRLPIQLSDPVR